MAKTKPIPHQDQLKELLTYDPETGVFRWKVRMNLIGKGTAGATWNARYAERVAGYHRDDYIVIEIEGIRHRAHRLAWVYTYGVEPPEEIDHRNGVKHDNRIDNLRLASHSENSQNRTKRVDNTSGFPGVRKQGEKWRAQVRIHRLGRIHLGIYETAEEAGRAVHEFKLANHPGYTGRNH